MASIISQGKDAALGFCKSHTGLGQPVLGGVDITPSRFQLWSAGFCVHPSAAGTSFVGWLQQN